MLIVVCGLPGTGKSALAQMLAKRLNAAVFNTDVIRRKIFKKASVEEVKKAVDPMQYDIQRAFFAHRIPAKWQALIWRQINVVYDALFKQAEETAAKKNLVLDATFRAREHRLKARRIARKFGKKFFLIECVCPQKEALERVTRVTRASRTRKVSNALRAAYFKVKKTWQPIREKHFVVNTLGSLKELRKSAVLLAQAIAGER